MLMSPGLERAVIEDLSHPNPLTRRAALSVLQHGGSAAAEQPLWDAFVRMRGKPIAPLEEGLETGFADALIKGFGWVLTPEKLDALESMCVTSQCREFAHSQRRFLERPISLGASPDRPWQVTVGGCFTYTRAQTLEKIRQFPRGTAFSLADVGARRTEWFWRQRTEELRKMLSDAGMKVAD